MMNRFKYSDKAWDYDLFLIFTYQSLPGNNSTFWDIISASQEEEVVEEDENYKIM